MTTEISCHDLTALLGRLDQEAIRTALARAVGALGIGSWTGARTDAITGCVGYAARKALIAIDYVDDRGHAGRIELALKHFAGWGGQGEAAQYHWLASVGAPIPRLVAALRDPDGDQVLLIERLPHLGYDPGDEQDAQALLTALARLNALPLPPADVLPLPSTTAATLAAGAMAELPKIIADARAGRLGEEIRALIADGAALWPRLEAYLAATVAEVATLPLGLIHGDAGPQNVGWRAGRRALLVFDLHKLHRGCILGDMIGLCGGDGGERAERLARHWLAELRRAGGPALDEATLRRGRMSSARLQHVTGWWWQRARSIDGMVDWTPDHDEGRRVYRGWLHGNLRQLRDELVQLERGQAAGAGV